MQNFTHRFCGSPCRISRHHSFALGRHGQASAPQFWCQQTRSDRVTAVAGGPPCETWSVARWFPGRPPPLRNRQCPWTHWIRRTHSFHRFAWAIFYFKSTLCLCWNSLLPDAAVSSNTQHSSTSTTALTLPLYGAYLKYVTCFRTPVWKKRLSARRTLAVLLSNQPL